MRTRDQIAARAKAEKQLAVCRDIIFRQNRDMVNLKLQIEDQKMVKDRLKQSQERTKWHLELAMKEMVSLYQKTGYDLKMSNFMMLTDTQQWKLLDAYIMANNDLVFHAYNCKTGKLPVLKREKK